MRLVIALGGNALLHRGERPDAAIQTARLTLAAPGLARLADEHELVLVHGNGPQVGMLAEESAADAALSAPYPLGALVAETQGLIGSQLSLALRNAGLAGMIATVITHTVIDADDPRGDVPSKFIGPSYDRRRARHLAAEHGWDIAEDGEAWRRVVPSPRPQRILEIDAARTLLKSGMTVVLAGGGGVAVDDHDGLHTIDAVVDKDHAAALIARTLRADRLVILTDVPGVIADYGTPDATVIAASTPAALRQWVFPDGSMGPKVTAVCDFVSSTRCTAAIGALEHAEEVVLGTVGTQVTPDALGPG
ncbi:carbamate kinase [Microbacterium sp. SSW1-49]|uniref:Carbamate kinase n=1 Tax=Microbacterium croceum TaxID=2851645 RepID=A0ABT0FFE4_9MICO|nr:carbamate kinase [Microbacterium croceum]MCK2036789.1 carbamate kinase [Microbacterium croceum]